MSTIIFHPANIFGYIGKVLMMQDGTRFTYDGAFPWVARKEVTDGRAAYWGELIYQTRDCVEMCAWLNAHQLGL